MQTNDTCWCKVQSALKVKCMLMQEESDQINDEKYQF